MRIPKYRLQTKRLKDGSLRKKGFVEIKTERKYFPGDYNSKESLAAYKRFIGKLVEEPKPAGEKTAKLRQREVVSLAEALETYCEVNHCIAAPKDPRDRLVHDMTHNRDADFQRPTESYHIARMAHFLSKYGETALHEFGPLSLKALQTDLKAAKRLKRCKEKAENGTTRWATVPTKKPLTVRYINDQISRVRRFFRWCVSEELIPAAVADALDKVEPVKASRSERLATRRQKKKVRSVDTSLIKAVLPFLSPTLSAMAQLHELTGMRPTELCTMRPMDIDFKAAESLWEYRPEIFKGDADEELEAIVPLGPKAQRLIKPFLDRQPFEYLFSPRESLSWYHAQRWKGKGTSKRREPKTYRTINDCFEAGSYRKAIARAAKKAGVPHWFPYQLRHSFGTIVRKKHGLEGAQVALRHKHADVTQIYAERNLLLARTIARDMG